MKKVGIVICNYNKADMVVECIKCIFENKYKDFDLYVVDNASTDNSVEAIREKYGNRLTLIVNSENLGGTGGFNTGLRTAYEKGYEYLMCVDNDAYLDENAIGNLVAFLDEHQECGMAASKVYHMEEPGRVQQFGQEINFTDFCTNVPDLNVYDDGTLPDFKYVDAVAACSLMVRRSTTEKIGFMSEEFFLYWDDTDWCWRCWLNGMRVASVGNSLALHQMGAKKEREDTFPTYYAWRNWIRFFIKYSAYEDFEQMSKTFLNGIFSTVYAQIHKGEKNLVKTVMLAYEDAIHGNTGKALENRIFKIDKNDAGLKKLTDKYQVFYIDEGAFPGLATSVRAELKRVNESIEFVCEPSDLAKTIKLCETIFLIDDMSLENVYIDLDMCIFMDKDDALSVINFNYSNKVFVDTQLPVFMEFATKLKKSIEIKGKGI